jgi:copper chaperone CopZ
MERMTLELPAMYGDHHVVDVRRILLGLEGVEEVYASSAFQAVEIGYDPEQTSPEKITAPLDEAGYTSEFDLPVEQSIPANEQKETAYFRHTEAFAETKNTVAFAQQVRYQRSPLWPCPGMGPLKPAALIVEEEESDG